MNAPNQSEITPILGTAMGAGFYAGRIRLDDGNVYALIVAPKTEGEHKPAIWMPDNEDFEGATSYNDGLANTRAMAEGGSELAKWAMDASINGESDWYLPSQDELKIIYRNLKPTTDQNYCWMRSGINLSAVEQTQPYTPDFPAQTMAELFQDGGSEAFERAWYWSSTSQLPTAKAPSVSSSSVDSRSTSSPTASSVRASSAGSKSNHTGEA